MTASARLTGISIIFLLLISVWHSPVFAAKKRVKIQKAAVSKSVGYSSVKLSRATNSVVLSLFNLSGVRKVSYTLSYTASGIEQGAVGSLSPSGSSEKRDLYFGTCSKGVCTPHRNISGAALLVTTTLSSGATTTKRYRIKI